MTLSRAGLRSSRRRFIVLLATLVIGAATPAAAMAYWDYSASLPSGNAYGEAQAGTSGYWNMRLSRAACGPDSWLRVRSTGNWSWFGVNCGGVNDYTDNYRLSTNDASHGLNAGGSAVFRNIRIDGSV